MADNDNIVDRLSIEISSDIQKAQSGIDKLKATLTSLQEAYDKAGNGGAAVKSNLQNLSDSVNRIANIDSGKLIDASNALKSLAKANIKGLSDGTKGVDSQSVETVIKLANAFQSLADVPDIGVAVKNIKKLASADFAGLSANVATLTDDTFTKLERVSVVMTDLTYSPDMSYFVKQMSRLASIDFAGLSANINSISPDIVSKLRIFSEAMSTLGATDYFDGIQNAIKGIRTVSTIDFKAFSENIRNIDENAAAKLKRFMETMSTLQGGEGVSDTIIQMQSFFSRDYSGFLQFAQSASTALPQLAEGIRQFAESAAVPGFSEAVDKLASLSNINFTDMLASLSLMNTTGIAPEDIVPDVSSQVEVETAETEQALSWFAKLFPEKFRTAFSKANEFVIKGSSDIIAGLKKPFDIMKTLGSSAVKLITNDFTSLGNRIKSAIKPVQQFVNSIGRILKYRAIRFILSEISKAVKEGTNNLYQYSKVVGTDFAKSMDTLATSAFYFKNSVGAMLGSIINSITPAIDKAVDKIVEFNNVINETIAKLTGASTWTRAIKIPKEYAEAANEATKETTKGLKESKETLKDFQMGFDELNVISDNPISNILDNGNTDAEELKQEVDYTLMFEEVNVDVDSWLDAFKKALDNSDFYGAGKILGEKLKDVFGNLPYEEWGRNLANAINNAVDFARGLLETKPFDELGEGVAKFLNTIFDEVDFKNVGIMIADLKNALVSGLYNFVSTFDFVDAGQAFADWFNGVAEAIDFDTVAKTIHIGLNGIITSVTEFLSNADVELLAEKLGKAFSEFDIGETLSNAGKAIKEGLDFILDAVNGFLEGVEWDKLGGDLFKGLSDFIFGNDWGETGSKAAVVIGNLATSVTEFLGGFSAELMMNSHDEEWLDNWIDGAEQYTEAVNNAKEAFVGWAEYVDESGGIFQTYLDFWGDIGESVYDAFHQTDEELEHTKELMEQYPSPIENIKNAFKDFFKSTNEGLENTEIQMAEFPSSLESSKFEFDDFVDVWCDGVDMLKDGFDSFVDNWCDGVDIIKDGIDKFVDNWSDGVDMIKGFFTNIVSSASSAWNNLVEGLNNTATKIKTVFTGIKTTVAKIMTDFTTKVKNAVDGMSSSVKSTFQNVKNFVSDIITGIKDNTVGKFNAIKEFFADWNGFESLMNYFKSLPEKMKESVENITNAIKKPFNSIPDFLKEMSNKAITVIEDLANGIIGGFNGIIDAFRSTISWASKITGNSKYTIEIPKMEEISLPRFEKGGFPNRGDLFFANESGVAEMVGSINNRTAVANNDQIVDAVSIGVAEATNAIMSEYIPQIIEAIMQNKVIEIDGKKISREIDNVKRTSGTMIYGGGVA